MKKQSWDITDPVTGDKYTLKEGMQVVVVRNNNQGADCNMFIKIGDTFILSEMGRSFTTLSQKWAYRDGDWRGICFSLVRPYNPPKP